MKGHIPGGGIASNKVTERPVRTGTGSHSARPGYVSQLGNKVGNHITDDKNTGYTGEKFHDQRNFNPTRFGNELATNVGKGGPGTGRTLHGQSGSQGCHGPVAGNPKPAGRDILSSFGPDYKRS